MAFRERFKRVFRRSSVASRDGSLREESKKQKTIPRLSTAATVPVSIASTPEIPLPISLKACKPAVALPKPTKAPAIIPEPTKASDPAPKPAKKSSPFPQPIPKVGSKSKPAKKKTPFPQPIPKVKSKSKPKAAPSPPEGVSAVRARFAHITPRKPKYDKNGKVKIELYKPHEVPPSKYRGPFDPKHIKALADYSWGAALTERPRSIVSQCSPMTELGPDGKVSLWAGNNSSQSKLREGVSRGDEVVKVEEQKTKKVDSPFGSIGQVTGMFDIPTSTSQQPVVSEAGKSQTDSEPYNPTSYQPSEMTTGSSTADTSLHSGVGMDGDTLTTLITNFTADTYADNDNDSFLMLTESHVRVFDTPSTPMSVLSPWSSNNGKTMDATTPLTEPGMLGIVKEGN